MGTLIGRVGASIPANETRFIVHVIQKLIIQGSAGPWALLAHHRHKIVCVKFCPVNTSFGVYPTSLYVPPSQHRISLFRKADSVSSEMCEKPRIFVVNNDRVIAY